jgi:uncharacterized protein
MRAARSVPLDALRGVALLGIIIVNAPFFAHPLQALPAAHTVLDAAAQWVTLLLFTGRFFLIFSFLFGFGAERQIARAEASGQGHAGAYARRLAGLFVFGALHATLLFFGDILMLYAVLGVAPWLCRALPPRRTLLLAGLILAAAIPVQALTLLAADGTGPQAAAGAGYAGSFADGLAQRLADLDVTLAFGLGFNALPALAMLLAGFAMGRLGHVPPQGEALLRLRRPAWLALLIGAGVSGILVALAGREGGADAGAADIGTVAGTMAFCAMAPLVAFGLSIVVLAAAERHHASSCVRLLASAGSASLSGYILHSLILGAVFNGWGLGLYGQVGPAGCLLAGVATFAAVATIIVVWKQRFRHGPEEWLLRSFAALAWQPMSARTEGGRTVRKRTPG